MPTREMVNNFSSIDQCFTNCSTNYKNSDVSAVVCCKNRQENLLVSLRSWIDLDNISEIIILDFGSSQKIEIPYLSSKIRLYRYESEYWHLTKAYNIAIQLSSKNIILKLDCDYVLKPNFFDNNFISHNEFLSGCGNKKIKYLNGFIMMHKQHFTKINGYNERIINYGYDDNDINNRLILNSIKKKPLDLNTITHIDHPNSYRTRYQPNHEINRSMSVIQNYKISKLLPWTIRDRMSSLYD